MSNPQLLATGGPDDDLPHPLPPNEPLWNESFLWHIASDDGEVSFWLKTGTSSWNREVTMEDIFICRPRGVVWYEQCYSKREENPNAFLFGGVKYRCIEPLKRWNIQYDGPMRECTISEMMAGPVPAYRAERVSFELETEAGSPMWYTAKKSMDGVMQFGKAHNEQSGRFKGWVNINGERREIKGTYFRDHSWGPRAMSGFLGHEWMGCLFPSGKTFIAKNDRFMNNGKLTHMLDAGIYDGTKWLEGVSQQSPAVTDFSLLFTPVEYHVKYPHGMEVVTGQPIHTRVMTMSPPKTLIHGFDRHAGKYGWFGILFLQTVRFTWRSETALGYLERSQQSDLFKG